MTTEMEPDRPPWQPRIEREHEFNPYVNATGQGEVPGELPPLDEPEAAVSAANAVQIIPGERIGAQRAPPVLHSVQDLDGFAIHATDGIIGHVKDVYVDDKAWVVRYLVVETGSWLSSRKVLISPVSIGEPDWAARVLPVSITQAQVQNSPDIDTDRPVSRQHEMQFLGYYGYPYYWAGAGFWGQGSYPGALLLGLGDGGSDAAYRHAKADDTRAEAEGESEQDGDPHLRSCKSLLRYHIEATDGGLGHVSGLLLDGHTWAVRYLIVDTSNWWLGHQVLIAPQWITEMSWPDAVMSVNLTQQAVKDAPAYDPKLALDRDQERRLFTHHGRAGYWAEL